MGCAINADDQVRHVATGMARQQAMIRDLAAHDPFHGGHTARTEFIQRWYLHTGFVGIEFCGLRQMPLFFVQPNFPPQFITHLFKCVGVIQIRNLQCLAAFI